MREQSRRAAANKLSAAQHAGIEIIICGLCVNNSYTGRSAKKSRKSLTFYKNTIFKNSFLKTATNQFQYLVFFTAKAALEDGRSAPQKGFLDPPSSLTAHPGRVVTRAEG